MCEVDGKQLVLDPRGVESAPVEAPGSGQRVEGDLRGKRVGIIDNLLAGMNELGDALAAELIERYQVSEVRRWIVPQSTVPDPALVEEITQDVDCVVIGLGNCGACSTWTCAFSARLRKNVPTLDVVTQPFAVLAQNAFRAHGLPEQPIVVLRAHAEEADDAEMRQFAGRIAEACASDLTSGSQ